MPTLALIATGGTIAGSGALHRYTAGVLDASILLAAVPELGELAGWHIEQPFALDSRDMHPAHWLQLAERIRALREAPGIDGIVITHGTDTLEETACALHWQIGAGKPVVLTAAMRPASSLSADGPLNLLQAARCALDPAAGGYGPLVVADSMLIHGDRLVKAHTHRPDALRSLDGTEAAGMMIADSVRWLGAPRPCPTPFALNTGTVLPRVDILAACAGASPDLIDACLAGGTAGIVLALSGHGSIPADWRPTLARAIAQDIVILRASRIAAGGVWHGCNEDDAQSGCIAAGLRTPQQARALLLLALASGAFRSHTALAALFARC